MYNMYQHQCLGIGKLDTGIAYNCIGYWQITVSPYCCFRWRTHFARTNYDSRQSHLLTWTDIFVQ